MKKVLFIGGGISGLTAGIFAQKSGFDSVIFEKHSILGGECTGWDRGEYHIDGCIRWLTGTKDGDELNNLWKQVGALENVGIHKADKLITFEYQGKQISIFRDLNVLRQHLLEISEEDKTEIEQLIDNIKTLGNVEIPCGKPFDLMSLWDIIKLGKSMKNAGKIEKALSHISVEEYCSRFKSPLIRKALNSIVPPRYNADALMHSLATFSRGDGDWPLGGSRAMAQRMVDKYLSLGGKINANTEIEKILIKDGTAIGVQAKNGSKEFGSYIIPACDTYITFNKLLNGRYNDKKFSRRYSDPANYLLSSCVYLSFSVDSDMKDYPEYFIFETAPFAFGNKIYNKVSINHYCFDNFAPKGKSVIICVIDTDENDYVFWKGLKQEPSKYKEAKVSLSNTVIACLEERFPELNGKITTLDVATPVTYERYCNAYKGAWMGFVSKSKRMIHDGKIKGIENLYMAGQWLMPPGGLPIALITGKWAIQRICKREKINFEE